MNQSKGRQEGMDRPRKAEGQRLTSGQHGLEGGADAQPVYQAQNVLVARGEEESKDVVLRAANVLRKRWRTRWSGTAERLDRQWMCSTAMGRAKCTRMIDHFQVFHSIPVTPALRAHFVVDLHKAGAAACRAGHKHSLVTLNCLGPLNPTKTELPDGFFKDPRTSPAN